MSKVKRNFRVHKSLFISTPLVASCIIALLVERYQSISPWTSINKYHQLCQLHVDWAFFFFFNTRYLCKSLILLLVQNLLNNIFYVVHPYTFDSWFVIINGLRFSSNNYDSLVKVINGLGSSQLDFRFLGCVQSWLWALTCKPPAQNWWTRVK